MQLCAASAGISEVPSGLAVMINKMRTLIVGRLRALNAQCPGHGIGLIIIKTTTIIMTNIYQVLNKLCLRDFTNIEGSCYHY